LTQAAQDRETLITLTSDIVAAHVSNNAVSLDQLRGLIGSIYEALSHLGGQPIREEPVLVPAVSIRASIKPEHVTCLDCGRKMKMLKRHLATEHGLGIEEYRQRWNLSAEHLLVAPNYADKRRSLAKQIGLGRKPRVASKSTPAKTVASAPAPKTAAPKATPPQATTKADTPAKARPRNTKLGLRFKTPAA
jgi:predicted transcriptional regulator